ncbi:MAG: hypothetical protein WA432_02920 [Candidatus Babeliaceae bacterium]
MKILLMKRKTSPGLYAPQYSSDHYRHDDFRMLGELLDEGRFHPYFQEWLQNPDYGITITDSFIYVEKINGRVKVYFPDPEDGKLIDPIPYDPFYEWASRLVQLSADFYEMADTIASNEIAIMYDNGQYYLKPIFLRSIAFRRMIRKEFEDDNEYDIQGFNETSKIGALGRFFTTMPNFDYIKEWLKSSEKEIPIVIGKLLKQDNKITIIYDKQERRFYTTQVPLSVFSKIIEYYEQFSSQKLDAFLLIEEPEHYSFMINPHEEIKIPIS